MLAYRKVKSIHHLHQMAKLNISESRGKRKSACAENQKKGNFLKESILWCHILLNRRKIPELSLNQVKVSQGIDSVVFSSTIWIKCYNLAYISLNIPQLLNNSSRWNSMKTLKVCNLYTDLMYVVGIFRRAVCYFKMHVFHYKPVSIFPKFSKPQAQDMFTKVNIK